MRGIHNFQLKKEAISLRKKGYTYPMITKKLFVPKATLNSWFTGLKLSDSAKDILLKRKKDHLVYIRKIAVDLSKTKKEHDFQLVKEEIENDFDDFDFNKNTLELLLAMLYLGEGFKKTRSHIGLGNSNPEIALMFVKLLKVLYNVKDKKFRCDLHLRLDQNEKNEKEYWSNKLGISQDQFRKTQFDKRTKGKKTWDGYHGVCSIYCYDAKIEKRLMFLQKYLINKILGS